VKWLCG